MKKYMEEHVGTNRTVKSYKRKDEEDGVPEEKIKKPAAGPFMVSFVFFIRVACFS